MLALPIYFRGQTYYLHTRVAGRQFKRSLKTASREMAIIKATKILEAVMIRKFEIDLAKGIFKAEGEEDYNRMISTLEIVERFGLKMPETTANPPQEHPEPSAQNTVKSGLKLLEVLDKLFLLRKNLSPATVMSYRNTITDLSKFLKNPYIQSIGKGDLSLYQEKLAKDGNSTRTIDNKIATIRAIFNFAIKQGYFFSENPAQNRNLLTKRDRIKSGYAIFTEDEIKTFFQSELFQAEKERDPDYYYAVLLAYFSGCRISEITGLTMKNIVKIENHWALRITQSKTHAGIREVPICLKIIKKIGFDKFTENKTGSVFKYLNRDGKGTGNAVGKKFSRHLEELKISREKLVFHSLRKFANDFFAKQRVSLEVRSQYFGHEVDNVNIQSYTNKLETHHLFGQIAYRQTLMFNLIF